MCPPLGATTDVGGLERARKLAALRVLQAGGLDATMLLPGVTGQAAYFDGAWDHLELPIALNDPLKTGDQSSSASMWVLPEGRSANELSGEQILWSHQRMSPEGKRYGLLVEERADNPDLFDLVWFDDGSPADPPAPRTTIASARQLHKWMHLGLTIDATSGAVQVFVDGAPIQGLMVRMPALSCPQLGTEIVETPAVTLNQQGAGSTGSSEVIFLARPENGLFGVDRIDASGFDAAPVVREGSATFQDPDYSPTVDKLVYSSNASGNFEIWMADGAGTNRKKLTAGFGDSGRGVFARRPRWAPDASAIIFESNAYVAGGDNSAGVYHLYYVAYDTSTNAVAIPAPNGGVTLQELNYNSLVGSISNYRLTSEAMNHTGVAWLAGAKADHSSLGEIAFSMADTKYTSFTVHTRVLPAQLTSPNSGDVLPMPKTADDVAYSARLLAANGRREGGVDNSRALVMVSKTAVTVATGFAFAATVAGDTTTVTVTHVPLAGCTGTCLPVEVHNLYLAFNDKAVRADLAASYAGPDLAAAGKTLELRDIGMISTTGTQRYVRIDVSGATTGAIPTGIELAHVTFRTVNAVGSTGLALKQREDSRRLYVKDYAFPGAPVLPLDLRLDLMGEVSQAAFSPDGQRLLVAGTSNARPTLVRATVVPPADPQAPGAMFSLGAEEIIAVVPTRTEGLSWAKVDRFVTCNRVAADQNPYSRQYRLGFRGALDELKVYSYVREAGAFRSDAERGHDWLKAQGRDGVLEPIRPTCSGLDTECPPYMLCNQATNKCEMRSCTTASGGFDPAACAGHGVCTWRPSAIEQEHSNFEWVCTSECNSDSQCLQRDCLNGPCRFCQSGACNECSEVEKTYTFGKVVEVVGCPDANAYGCPDGSCVTSCYSFENGHSKYLCNPTEQFCSHGRCEALHWDWSDLGPSSLAGLGEMKLNTPGLSYTVALPQVYQITVRAYGVEDYIHSPQLLVEGKIAGSEQAFLGQWFPIGRILVHNRTDAEASNNPPYYVTTPYSITHVRIRLVTPPGANLNASATGLGFNGEDVHKASGSQFMLGYSMGVPVWQAYTACDARGRSCAGQLGQDQFRNYLRGGEPAVVVLEVGVNGAVLPPGAIVDRICSYEGSDAPAPLLVATKKVTYGDIVLEQSNEKVRFCANHPDRCQSPTTVLPFNAGASGAAVLNCSYFDPEHSEQSAGLEIALAAPPQPETNIGSITEYADGTCLIEVPRPGGSPTTKPCYEYAGGDVSMDPMNPGGEPVGSHGLLDFDVFRSFAWSKADGP